MITNDAISKVHHDYYLPVSGAYKPIAPANAPLTRWPSSPVTRMRKASQYTPKDDWRQLVQEHGNATTNRQVQIDDFKIISDFAFQAAGSFGGQPGSIQMRGLPWNNTFPGTISPAVINDVSGVSATQAYATTKFLASIHESSIGVSAGVMIGEMGETLRMLRSPMHALRNAYQTYIGHVEYKALKAKIGGLNKVSRRRVLNDVVAETWLEVQFGMIPLMKDIEGLVEAVRDLDLRNSITQVSAMHTSSTAPSPGYYNARMNDIDLSYSMIQKTVVTVYSKCGLLPHVTDVLGAVGLRGFEFVPTIYNLIPYSFVVDYFTNLNSLVTAAITIRDRITYSSISTVVETSSNLFVKDTGTHNSAIKNLVRDPSVCRSGHYRWSKKTLDRRDTIPPLELVYRMPSIKQTLNLAALITSADRTSYKLRGL